MTRSRIELPTEASEPQINPTSLASYILGLPKLGKSTLAAGHPGVIFLDFSGEIDGIRHYGVRCFTWEDALEACALIAKGGHGFHTVAIDTIDDAYARCTEYVLAKLGIQHESEAEFGKGWSMVIGEFKRVLTRLNLLPYGLVMVGHAKQQEFKTRTGREQRVVPTLPVRAARVVTGMADLILYADIDSTTLADGTVRETHVIRTKPTTAYQAGDRYNLLPDTLELRYDVYERALHEGLARRNAAIAAGEIQPADPLPASAEAAPFTKPATAPVSPGATGTPVPTAPAGSPPPPPPATPGGPRPRTTATRSIS